MVSLTNRNVYAFWDIESVKSVLLTNYLCDTFTEPDTASKQPSLLIVSGYCSDSANYNTHTRLASSLPKNESNRAARNGGSGSTGVHLDTPDFLKDKKSIPMALETTLHGKVSRSELSQTFDVGSTPKPSRTPRNNAFRPHGWKGRSKKLRHLKMPRTNMDGWAWKVFAEDIQALCICRSFL